MKYEGTFHQAHQQPLSDEDEEECSYDKIESLPLPQQQLNSSPPRGQDLWKTGQQVSSLPFMDSDSSSSESEVDNFHASNMSSQPLNYYPPAVEPQIQYMQQPRVEQYRESGSNTDSEENEQTYLQDKEMSSSS